MSIFLCHPVVFLSRVGRGVWGVVAALGIGRRRPQEEEEEEGNTGSPWETDMLKMMYKTTR